MNARAYLSLVMATFFWGANAVAAKMAVGEISPMLLNTLRWLSCLVIMTALARGRLRQDLPAMRRHAGLLFILGSLSMTGFSVALYIAATMTSAINLSIEQAAMPGLVMLGNLLLFGTRARPVQIVGASMTIAGVAFTALHGDLTGFASLDVNMGDAVMLAGLLCYGAYTIFLRFRPAMHWQSLMVALMLAGTISSLPFALWEAAMGGMSWPTPTGWAILAFSVLFPSLLAQPLYVHGTEAIGSNRAGVFYNLTPIFGVVLSILVLGEIFHSYHGVAIAMVVCGIALAEYRRRTPAPAQ